LGSVIDRRILEWSSQNRKEDLDFMERGAFYYIFGVFYSIAFVCQYTYNATQTTFKK